ncbi:pyridoxine 5'-phosphate synthase [Porticoccaceae bacterium]|jgi:pyridoxine 5-phosphate synthase|nr:pyridoxine 5'-phosphate synthase [Porticoccaceae bacterium]MBT6319373.1 pyridoxine 5'-phosphate synthase [Porticoccaceae bacterium]MBT7258715.1 pyridoxine 5'-phosphate synthase [Porticoccaceae bacterium]MBT7904523.1 pyridoxine 5'-phosphate synthase [Porticoccaceae bacterium]MDA7815871.1 pyridoxine 5'-phosphate synthase [Porticoccaceae bacterium]
MTALSINLNKIALLRNSREGNYPSVVNHAQLCIDQGVEGITVHPRPDQRHIRPSDVRQLAELVRPLSGVEFNIEGNPFAPALNDYPGFIELVEETQPDQCTLVPDGDDQLTSDHGFDLNSSGDQLAPIIKRLKDQGMRVSLFMDPDLSQIEMAANIGADRIELYTGPYAAAWGTDQLEPLFQSHLAAAELAVSLGMGVNAGHDLNLDNLAKYASIPALLEVSIGHAFTVDSLAMGMANAVNAYLQRLR